jgi:hypothetical protein
MTDVPSNLKAAAILQLVSGLITTTVMCFLSYFTIGMIGGLCTFFIGGLGAICGIVAWALIPIGIFEIVSGIVGLANPKAGAPIMKVCSFVELGSILVGGLTTAIAGGVVMALLRNPEIEAWFNCV